MPGLIAEVGLTRKQIHDARAVRDAVTWPFAPSRRSVVDTASGSQSASYDRSLRSVASGGKIVQIGVLTGFGPKPDLARLQWENADIIGVTVGSIEHFTTMNRFLTENAIHPIVDRVYGFDEVPEAFAHLRTGSHFGKIVVKL